MLYDIVLYARHFVPVKSFPSINLIYYAFSYPAKCNVDRRRSITRLISTSTDINGYGVFRSITSLKRARRPIIFLAFFETVRGGDRFIGSFYFWGITLMGNSVWNSVKVWKILVLPKYESYGIEVLFWEAFLPVRSKLDFSKRVIRRQIFRIARSQWDNCSEWGNLP